MQNGSAPPNSQVLVLLATYNGAQWLDEQLVSIAVQSHGRIRVAASDDGSADETPDILNAWSDRIDLEILPPATTRFGNANRNFIRLISDVPAGGCDYVAFCDQDDIWDRDKVRRAVDVLARSGAGAYSSNVVAIWPDGTRRTITKSQRQREFDYLFEAPGPGSTFVLRRAEFDQLRAWVRSNRETVDRLKVHDWAIYAFARQSGWRWVIDDWHSVLYRQHNGNEVGANVGVRAALGRLSVLYAGIYRQDVLRIAAAVGHKSWVTRRLAHFSLFDRLALAVNAGNFRRCPLQALALAGMFLFMKRQPEPYEASAQRPI